MVDVVIYTKPFCPRWQKALEDYKARGIKFKKVNTIQDTGVKKCLKKYGAGKVSVIV